MKNRTSLSWMIVSTAVIAAVATTPGISASKSSSAPDSGTVLKGDSPGTVFKTLTIEGEDRVHLEIARPKLRLDVDPASAPGLELGGAEDVLNRTRPDLMTPLFETVALAPTAYTGRPWLEIMATGPVARFHPNVGDVETWRLSVTDARGRVGLRLEGRGTPPRTIEWDGLAKDGSMALPGLTYSYALEAKDRAGNQRTFMGEGFEVPAYRCSRPDGEWMVLPGAMVDARDASLGPTPSVLLEVASWLDQMPTATPIEIAATARSHDRAASLAQKVRARLEPIVVGDAARFAERVIVEPDAPEAGAVVVRTRSEVRKTKKP